MSDPVRLDALFETFLDELYEKGLREGWAPPWGLPFYHEDEWEEMPDDVWDSFSFLFGESHL
jgi:hypothetical protein